VAEWTIPFDDEATTKALHDLLFLADAQRPRPRPDLIEFLVDRYHGLKIEVFAREHPPPHFRVSCGAGTGNYRIDNCEQLNGDLRAEYRVIREWHELNQEKLIKAWNRSRPSDCPVGPIRAA
jgi:hypothetical protein